MTVAQDKSYYSFEEYLELEVNSEERHEYRDGQIILMNGGTPNHNKMAGNLYAALNFLLKRQPYEVFFVDQRMWIPTKRIYTYPDVIIVQSPLVLVEGRTDTITNPLVIAEVLSKSTSSYDRDQKFAAYRTIPSFLEYILLDQYTMHVEQYFKTDDNKWIFSEYEGRNVTLALASVNCQILMADIYEKVDFD